VSEGKLLVFKENYILKEKGNIYFRNRCICVKNISGFPASTSYGAVNWRFIWPN